MSLDPIIVNIEPPKSPFFSKLPKLPSFGPKQTKILTAIAAIVIVTSMVLIALVTTLANNNKFKASRNIQTAQDVQSKALAESTTKSNKALPGGTEVTGVSGTSGENSPKVTLKADPGSVLKGGKVKLSWTVTNNPKSCVASEDWSGPRASTGSEMSPTLDKVQTYLFTLTCKTDTGTGFSTVSISATDQGGTGNVATRPTVSIAGSPSSIYSGQATSLVWSVSNNPTSCIASGDWSGSKPISGSASTGALTTVKSYTYTLTCTNSGGSGFATTTVAVLQPPPGVPIISLSVNPPGPSVVPGTNATLSWSVTNAASCSVFGDWAGTATTRSPSGSEQTGVLSTLSKTYSYGMECKNSAGDLMSSSVELTVLRNAPGVAITASPTSVAVGSSSTLTWSSTEATTCAAKVDWSNAIGTSGSQSTGALNSIKTYNYSITCSNEGGTTTKSASVTVLAAPQITNFSASPTSVTTGGSSTLSWTTANATSCTASGGWSGAKSTSGSQSTGVLGATTSYTLTCSNTVGSTQSSTSVTFSSGVASSPPVVTINAASPTVGVGGNAVLTWSATNSPTSCTASGGWSGAKAASGSGVSVGPLNTAGTTTLTLQCTNSAGSGSSSVSVTVVAVPVVTISVSPASIVTGNNTTVTWSSTNSPSSCTAGGGWSGSKSTTAGNNTQTTGSALAAGSYVLSLSCTNAGGTGSNSTSLTVTAGAVYCSNSRPCYGPNSIAAFTTIGSCYGYNVSGALSWVINVTTLNQNYHKGGPGKNLLPNATSPLCGANLHPYLTGTSLTNVGSQNHVKGAATNGSVMPTYRVGYWDATNLSASVLP